MTEEAKKRKRFHQAKDKLNPRLPFSHLKEFPEKCNAQGRCQAEPLVDGLILSGLLFFFLLFHLLDVICVNIMVDVISKKVSHIKIYQLLQFVYLPV